MRSPSPRVGVEETCPNLALRSRLVLLLFLPLISCSPLQCFKNWRENSLGCVKEAQKKQTKPEAETGVSPNSLGFYRATQRMCKPTEWPRGRSALLGFLAPGVKHKTLREGLLISSMVWRWELKQLLHGLTQCAGPPRTVNSDAQF